MKAPLYGVFLKSGQVFYFRSNSCHILRNLNEEITGIDAGEAAGDFPVWFDPKMIAAITKSEAGFTPGLSAKNTQGHSRKE